MLYETWQTNRSALVKVEFLRESVRTYESMALELRGIECSLPQQVYDDLSDYNNTQKS